MKILVFRIVAFLCLLYLLLAFSNSVNASQMIVINPGALVCSTIADLDEGLYYLNMDKMAEWRSFIESNSCRIANHKIDVGLVLEDHGEYSLILFNTQEPISYEQFSHVKVYIRTDSYIPYHEWLDQRLQSD